MARVWKGGEYSPVAAARVSLVALVVAGVAAVPTVHGALAVDVAAALAVHIAVQVFLAEPLFSPDLTEWVDRTRQTRESKGTREPQRTTGRHTRWGTCPVSKPPKRLVTLCPGASPSSTGRGSSRSKRMCKSFFARSTALPEPRICTYFHTVPYSLLEESDMEIDAPDFFASWLM